MSDAVNNVANVWPHIAKFQPNIGKLFFAKSVSRPARTSPAMFGSPDFADQIVRSHVEGLVRDTRWRTTRETSQAAATPKAAEKAAQKAAY